MIKRRWKYAKRPSTFDSLKKETMLSDLTLQILVSHGIDDPIKIDKFLNDNIHHLYDTRLMKDAEKGVQIIKESILAGEKIGVYGDYDDDGAIAMSIFLLAMRKLGANVYHHTSDRFTQGYGMVISGVDDMLAKEPDTKLIVTVDNGISAFEGVNYVKSKGIKVVVTDHHEPKSTLPLADAVIDPKRTDETYPCSYLCGAGVIWKMMLLLFWEMEEDLSFIYDMLDLVAMATVGDVVPILDENRILVKEGIKRIKDEKRMAFRVLREVTGVSEISSHYTLGFVYVPMVNAAGRLLGNVDLAVEFFTSTDEERVIEIANKLKELNEERKAITVVQEKIAEEFLANEPIRKVIFVENEGFHEGIVGLVAGRLKESHNRPSFVLKKEKNGVLKGSARSIPGLHLKNILDECAELLLGYGGHELAAGLSLKAENYDAFKKKFFEIADTKLSDDDLIKVYNVAYRLKPSEITLDLIDSLKELEPFGASFDKPILKVEGFKVQKVYFMGDDSQHVKLAGPNDVSLIMWREAEKYISRGEPTVVDALGYPEINVYRNKVNIQFTVNADNFMAG